MFLQPSSDQKNQLLQVYNWFVWWLLCILKYIIDCIFRTLRDFGAACFGTHCVFFLRQPPFLQQTLKPPDLLCFSCDVFSLHASSPLWTYVVSHTHSAQYYNTLFPFPKRFLTLTLIFFSTDAHFSLHVLTWLVFFYSFSLISNFLFYYYYCLSSSSKSVTSFSPHHKLQKHFQENIERII